MPAVDVVVIGAGPSGAVAASVLARAGRRVLLAGRAAPARRVGESLIGGARPLLRALGFLSLVEAAPHLPSYGNVSVWGSNIPVATDFIRDPNGLGWHLDRPRFDADLRQAAVAHGATWSGERVGAIRRRGDAWSLRLGGCEVRPRWVIDATGRGATVARRLGARRQMDQALFAYYGWVPSGPSDRDGRTFIEAVEHGWWYTARLPSRLRIAVLHTDIRAPAEADGLRRFWSSELAVAAFVKDFLHGQEPTVVRAADASGGRLDLFHGDRWLATGDAALSFDPLSSQGLFNAICTGMLAGQAIDAALDNDQQPLLSYQSRLEQVRESYLHNHDMTYRAEGRWPESSFWRSRVLS